MFDTIFIRRMAYEGRYDEIHFEVVEAPDEMMDYWYRRGGRPSDVFWSEEERLRWRYDAMLGECNATTSRGYICQNPRPKAGKKCAGGHYHPVPSIESLKSYFEKIDEYREDDKEKGIWRRDIRDIKIDE